MAVRQLHRKRRGGEVLQGLRREDGPATPSRRRRTSPSAPRRCSAATRASGPRSRPRCRTSRAIRSKRSFTLAFGGAQCKNAQRPITTQDSSDKDSDSSDSPARLAGQMAGKLGWPVPQEEGRLAGRAGRGRPAAPARRARCRAGDVALMTISSQLVSVSTNGASADAVRRCRRTSRKPSRRTPLTQLYDIRDMRADSSVGRGKRLETQVAHCWMLAAQCATMSPLSEAPLRQSWRRSQGRMSSTRPPGMSRIPSGTNH